MAGDGLWQGAVSSLGSSAFWQWPWAWASLGSDVPDALLVNLQSPAMQLPQTAAPIGTTKSRRVRAP